MKRFWSLFVAILLCTATYAVADSITVHWGSPVQNIGGSQIIDLVSFNVYSGTNTNFVKGTGVLTNFSNGVVSTPALGQQYEVPVDVPEGTWITITALDSSGNESGFANPVEYADGASLDIPDIPTSIYLTKP